MRKKPFSELLKIELEGWCYGIANYPGEITAPIIHRIIEELQPSLLRAMEEGVEIDFYKLASKISQAAKYIVDEREIVTSLLMNFPNPKYLSPTVKDYFEKALDKVSKVFPEVIQILEMKWRFDEEAIDEEF